MRELASVAELALAPLLEVVAHSAATAALAELYDGGAARLALVGHHLAPSDGAVLPEDGGELSIIHLRRKVRDEDVGVWRRHGRMMTKPGLEENKNGLRQNCLSQNPM